MTLNPFVCCRLVFQVLNLPVEACEFDSYDGVECRMCNFIHACS